jgi:hypothetical protein
LIASRSLLAAGTEPGILEVRLFVVIGHTDLMQDRVKVIISVIDQLES